MALIRPSTLLLATAMDAPALWHVAVSGDLDVTVAMVLERDEARTHDPQSSSLVVLTLLFIRIDR